MIPFIFFVYNIKMVCYICCHTLIEITKIHYLLIATHILSRVISINDFCLILVTDYLQNIYMDGYREYLYVFDDCTCIGELSLFTVSTLTLAL